ncbi:hypothetical protein GCM10010397_39190 [Streptomyces spinoverrucosus]|nr:hypothetical protein GCM10010397_39190 [Streptomyces spinoverrucosus]
MLTGPAGCRGGSVGHKLSFVFGISDEVRGTGNSRFAALAMRKAGVRRYGGRQVAPVPAYD